MSTTGSQKKEDLAPPPPKPILSLLMVCASPLGLSDGKGGSWIASHGFTARHFQELIDKQDPNVVGYLMGTTFAQLSPWLFVINAFFMWTFGSLIEQKLIGWRYPAFLTLGLFGTYGLVALDCVDNPDKMFIGPTMFLLYMLGGYLAFLPKKPFKPADWVKPGWRIFREDAPPQIFERYWVSPWVFIIAFAVYSLLLQFALSKTDAQINQITKQPIAAKVHRMAVGPVSRQVAAFAVIPAIETVLLGAFSAFLFSSMITRPSVKRPGGKLQLKVIQHYRELRTLDMTHDQAVEGAAKFTAVPLDIARDWIAKGVAAVKDPEK